MSVMFCARNKTTCAHSVELFVDVHVVKRHAIVDVLCRPVVNVVIGVHIVMLSVPLVVVHYVFLIFLVVILYQFIPLLSPYPFFTFVFHCILTAFQVWYLHLSNLWRVRVSVSRLPILVFLFLQRLFQFLSKRQAICDLDVMSFGFFVSLTPDQIYPFGGVSFNNVNLVKPVHVSDRFLSPSTL